MPPLLTPRRSGSDVSLTAAVPQPSEADPRPAEPDAPAIGWLPYAVIGGFGAAVVTWILGAGLTVVGWLTASPGTLSDALSVGTRLWLLGNGVSARIGVIPVTLVPWGATAVAGFLLYRLAMSAARQVRADQSATPGVVALTITAAYLAPVLAVAVFSGEPWQAPGHWAAVIVALAACAAWGASRVLGWPVADRWPGWVKALPRAVLAGQLTMLAAGAGLLVTGLLLHLDRVESLTAALDPGAVGGIALLLAQLAVTPNAFVWSGSYALGSGFTLGGGSLVAPSATQLGVVPGIPILAALPGAGPGGTEQLWWLAAGALAGGIAAWVTVRALPAWRFDLLSLLGGLAGVLSGAAFAALAWAASGDLGSVRLAGLGPRLVPLLVMGMTTMGLAGLITGLLLGLVRRWRRPKVGPKATEATPASDRLPKPTAVASQARSKPEVGATQANPEAEPTAGKAEPQNAAPKREPASTEPKAHPADQDAEPTITLP
jgi:hypothetical protein